MNYEQKYKKALEKARQLCAYPTTKPFISDLQDLFPELNESEDKQIRKELIDYLKERKSGESYGQYVLRYDRWINLLEKQDESDETKAKEFLINKGYPIDMNDTFPTYEEMYNIIRDGLEQQSEQNNDDKYEPKFKVGDWIVFNGLTLYINEVVKGYYRTISKGGIPNSYDWDIDAIARLWNIENAKDGDVLCVKYGNNEMPLIFTGKQKGVAYCSLNSFGEFVLSMADWLLKTSVSPATKEQRDLLFKKMQEADYVWNAEKKVLEKIKPKFHVGDWIISTISGCVYKIIGLSCSEYEIMSDDYKTNLDIKIVDNNFKIWSIENAKDGDVLCTYECGEPKIVFILKGKTKKPYVLSYHCFYNIMYSYLQDDSVKGCLAPNEEDVKPATKEQIDLLFQKMKESGYEWDDNKKELKEEDYDKR